MDVGESDEALDEVIALADAAAAAEDKVENGAEAEDVAYVMDANFGLEGDEALSEVITLVADAATDAAGASLAKENLDEAEHGRPHICHHPCRTPHYH